MQSLLLEMDCHNERNYCSRLDKWSLLTDNSLGGAPAPAMLIESSMFRQGSSVGGNEAMHYIS